MSDHSTRVVRRPSRSSLHVAAGRRARRHRLLRRARHVGRRGVDAPPRAPCRTPTPPTSASTTSPTSHGVPDGPSSTAPKPARLVDCRTELVREGLMALQCGAFHITHRRQDLLQHHAARPCRHRHAAGAGDARRRRRHLGRRQHLQGQRHRALLPLRAAGQPGAAHLQAVARRRLRRRARRPRRDERVPRIAHGLPYRDATEKAYSTDANIWGATHEAKPLEELSTSDGDRRADHGRRPLGPRRRRDRQRGRHGRRSHEGWPVAINGHEFADHGRAGDRGQRHRRPPRAGHERPDREPDHRGQEPRHLRGAGAGAAAHRLRATGDGDPQREHDRELPHDGPAPRVGCSTRAAGSTRRA